MNYREALSRIMLSVVAVLLALLSGAVLLQLSGHHPLEAYSTLLRGGLGLNMDWQMGERIIDRPVRLGNMLNEASLLILVAIGIAIPLWCGMINLGAEGQIMLGGLGAVLAALYLPPLPPVIHIVIILASGSLFGAGWAALAGALRVYRQLNEIITTIMLNFVAFWTISLLCHGPLKDQESTIGYPWTMAVSEAVRLPFIHKDSRVLLILVFSIGFVLAATVLRRYTKLGFKLRASGLEPGTAAFVGFPVGRLQVLAMALSGAVCGFAGACLLIGLQFRLSDAFASNYGFDALAVVLVGQGHPLGVAGAGLIFGTLRTGAEAMEVTAGVPKSLGVVLQAFALLFLMLVQGKALATWWRTWRMRKGRHA